MLSCVNQDIPVNDYEIIAVNDGSPDRSIEIVSEFAKQYSNIIILNQENQGLSMARNNGLAKAQGEYVWFIDSDDYIEENCLRRITDLLNNDIDILQLQYRYVYEDGTSNKDANKYIIDNNKNGLDVIMNGGLPIPAQFSIYKVSLLRDNNIEFMKGIYHEDVEFKPRVTFFAKKIASDSCVSYNYLQRVTGSITSSLKLKNGIDLIAVMNSLFNFISKQKVNSAINTAFYNIISVSMNSALLVFSKLSDDDKLILEQSLKQNKHLFNCMIKTKNIKYMIEGICFSIDIQWGLKLYSLLKR